MQADEVDQRPHQIIKLCRPRLYYARNERRKEHYAEQLAEGRVHLRTEQVVPDASEHNGVDWTFQAFLVVVGPPEGLALGHAGDGGHGVCYSEESYTWVGKDCHLTIWEASIEQDVR